MLRSVEWAVKGENPSARFVETNGAAIATITRPNCDSDCSEVSCCEQWVGWFSYAMDVFMKCAIRGRWIVPKGAENPHYIEVAQLGSGREG